MLFTNQCENFTNEKQKMKIKFKYHSENSFQFCCANTSVTYCLKRKVGFRVRGRVKSDRVYFCCLKLYFCSVCQ